ncbi:hypothetical protein PIN17_A0283 [Prevotella intermedia 17]|nr:hypothetical protein PIN17_A0283 [Prevotella intermedia 17]
MQKSTRNSEVEALNFNNPGVVLTNIQTLRNKGMQPLKIKHATLKAAYMAKEDN